MSLRHERDSSIRGIIGKHNLGLLPDVPFSEDLAASLTNRIKTKLLDLEKDLQEKKVHLFLNITFLYFLIHLYMAMLPIYSTSIAWHACCLPLEVSVAVFLFVLSLSLKLIVRILG